MTKRKGETSRPTAGEGSRQGEDLSQVHLRFGWWIFLWFLLLGLVLEALHAFKIGWYLDVASAPRRFAWTLAHAHGALLGLVNVLFGASMHRIGPWSARSKRVASICLLLATVILPAGFFLGGLFPYEGDPGIGIFLVPLGGGLLAVSVLLIALSCRSRAKD